MSSTKKDDDGSSQDVTRLSRYATERSLLPMAATEGATHIVRYANPAFCRLTGKEKEELFGQALAVVIPKGDLDKGISYNLRAKEVLPTPEFLPIALFCGV